MSHAADEIKQHVIDPITGGVQHFVEESIQFGNRMIGLSALNQALFGNPNAATQAQQQQMAAQAQAAKVAAANRLTADIRSELQGGGMAGAQITPTTPLQATLG
jgi:hypothetical protein